jgi:hypothetical protein
MNYEDGEYYWVLPKETDEWEIACARKSGDAVFSRRVLSLTVLKVAF